jgi:hypothetical protein
MSLHRIVRRFAMEQGEHASSGGVHLRIQNFASGTRKRESRASALSVLRLRRGETTVTIDFELNQLITLLS